MKCWRTVAFWLVVGLTPGFVYYLTPTVATPPADEEADPDARVDPLKQPDFNLATLPTTLRMPCTSWRSG